ncbi:tubulin polyglutamylase complex subunit 2 [Phlebotomus argentipes]|uniref:tubulin polyglutamylase complex subunit 2 n=1 Tax=Phlebotomus argentipes TaxID=94469 RepID=UPI0028929D62|nr:tubulin polyglutamylase complex subunit 2 [Phlebotomus argentipes]
MSVSSLKPSVDDTFYEYLTLNLSKVLNAVPRITNVTCEKRYPCEAGQIATWEQRHNVYLPDDMKRFYLSTDGFTLHWSYQYSPNDTRRVGYINIPQICHVTLLREKIESLMSAQNASGSGKSDMPNLCLRSKIFELSNICDIAKVCLIYESPDLANPKIFLLEVAALKWTFLAETFTEYLRMTIAHLGLPYWELCFSNCGLPSWTEQLFLLLAPHLLEKSEPRRSRVWQNMPEQPPYNILDPSIFRTKPKCTRQSQKMRQN